MCGKKLKVVSEGVGDMGVTKLTHFVDGNQGHIRHLGDVLGDRLGRWRRQRERRTNSQGDPRRSQTLPGCPWSRNLTGVGISLGDLHGFLSPLGFLGQNAMDGDQTVVPRGTSQGLGSDPE